MFSKKSIMGLLLIPLAATNAFVTSSGIRQTQHNNNFCASSTALAATDRIENGDPVLLVGPGFAQLVLAKHMARAGLKPIVVASQTKLDSFFKSFLKTGDNEDHIGDEDVEGIHKQIRDDATIGMPEIGDPYFGELKGVVFCAEEAVLPPDFITRVLDFQDQGQSAFANGAPARTVCMLPVSNKVVKEKSNSWIPIFNMDRKTDDNWSKFESAFKAHPSFSKADGNASIVRFGSLLGGSTDGPPVLSDYGLDEGMYKMTLEQYRDMRERAFDRYKLSAQVLAGNAINPRPDSQDAEEKEALAKLPGNVREMFTILGEYPEIDRTNRHTLASGIVQVLQKPATDGGVCSKECTILSKAASEMPTAEEWSSFFESPGPAAWPDPAKFDPEIYGMNIEEAN
mmetsp:Transcript_1036/g.2596  ORF Transcript_1036/g.2596 Transcript_1036/m.2596 type:complete len:398 (-) Transcript_1036:191-1384(-)